MRPFGLNPRIPLRHSSPNRDPTSGCEKGGALAPHFHQLTTSKGRVTDEELGGSKIILVSR